MIAQQQQQHARAVGVAVVVAGIVVVGAGSGCRPLGLAGDSCKSGPCAIGLVCIEEICTAPTPTPPPPAPCEVDEDCSLNGSADGRVCTDDGTCAFADCFIDLQCGIRICDNGQCAEREFCLENTDCAPLDGVERVCDGGACRAACQADEECPALGGVSVAACVEGICTQRCLGDFMCLGGQICEANLCVEPQCGADEECADAGPGQYFCDGGRCLQFTPCEEDEDCFDPNFFCNVAPAAGPVRCEERAACTVDAECGLGLCLDRHCRDAVACDADPAACVDGVEECVAGRCVDAPECRSDADCTGAGAGAGSGEVCDVGRCQDAPDVVAPDIVAVATPYGVCWSAASTGAGSAAACTVPCVAPASVRLRAQGYGEDGLPVSTALPSSTDADCSAAAAGTDVDVTFGTVTVTLAILAPPPAGTTLDLVVVDAPTGAPVSGAEVYFADDDVADGATDAAGRFTSSSFGGGALGVAAADGRAFALLDVAPSDAPLYVPLARLSDGATDDAAGYRATVNGTGDDVGDVGVGLALPTVRSPLDASALLGAPVAASLELPILGAVPIFLPSTSTLDATLPIAGTQEVKGEAFGASVDGPGTVVAFEGRFDQQLLFQFAFGADPVESALDIAGFAEGMDALVAAAGALEAVPLVVDELDIDADGDTLELVPDFAAFPLLELAPETPPLERVALTTTTPPAGARNRAFAACGIELPHGFLTLGIGTLFGSDAVDVALGEQVRVVAAPAAVAGHTRACSAHALFLDGSGSALVARRPDGAFAPAIVAGAFLPPPGGTFLLPGVPAAGDVSVVLPELGDADAVIVTVLDDHVWQLAASPSSGALVLPPFIDGNDASLAGVRSLRLGVDVQSALGTQARALDDVAAAVAIAP